MRRSLILSLLLLVTLASFAGCVAAPSHPIERVPTPTLAAAAGSPGPALAPAGPTLGSQSSGDLQAWLSSKPAQPLRGTAEMDAYLLGADGQPITDAKVTFDSDMTNMSHGLNLVAAEPVGDGHFVGSVHFMMPGPWRVIAIVERPGKETAKLRFEFVVKMK